MAVIFRIVGQGAVAFDKKPLLDKSNKSGVN